MSSWVRPALAAAGAASLAVVGLAAVPASAVNTAHSVVVSSNPVNFTPHVRDGAVKAVVQLGSKIVAAGTFTQVSQTASGTIVTRNRMFAFDATTGVIDSAFNPNFNGNVNSLDTDGTFIYAGGTFSTVGGITAQRVAKLTASGQLVTNAQGANLLRQPNSAVNEVVVRGSRLYVGGAFSSVGGTARQRLAALNTSTGAVLAEVNVPFAGVYDPAIGGTTNIKRFDVTADGSKLAAVGNFSTVGGQTRSQLAVIDLPATGNASVSPWATDRYDAAHNDCATVFDTFMRDIDFSPDGSYFVVTSTGAFAGGAGSGTLCDTATRWETSPAASGRQPTWVDYTGGDTLYGVAVTGAAVYVGGHQRWHNNSFQGDNAGPGAVPREGIAALDPVNGLPLSWNPGRSRGVGAEALYATSQGLWVGSDTDRIGGETHRRIALMPLAGGTAIPDVPAASLPNDLFLAERGGDAVLYRVNAGGPAVASIDDGPAWEADQALTSPYRNTGSNASEWGAGHTVDATVPGGTPSAVFNNERWDPAVVPEMEWNFAVPAGQSVGVRLYFANRYSGTAQPGQRVFDVRIDNVTRLDNYDIVADVGHAVGTMKQFTITSDGNIDIDFLHGVENPLISAIEIVDATSGSVLLRRPVDAGGSPTGPASTANTAMDWSTVRGAALLNGTLYYGSSNGNLYARGFNAGTGAFTTAQRTVNLYDDPDTGERIPFAIGNVTGMFYDPATHRLYYTLAGDANLYYRYFTPESEIVGAEQFVAASNGVNFSTVAGMTLASGRIYYGSSADGSLRAVAFSGGAVTGSPTVTSSDGSWRYRAIFVRNG